MKNSTPFIPPMELIKIYTAGKTWAGHIFRDMKKYYGFNIVARWIDAQDILANVNDTFPDAIHNDKEYLQNIWQMCFEDCGECDVMILAAQPQDENDHSGSLVELGHVAGPGSEKPVYLLGTCQSFEPYKNSDRAFLNMPHVYHWPEYTDETLHAGFTRAIQHYQEHYAQQWRDNNSDFLLEQSRQKALH